ncbi:MAG: flagellar hook-associated protein FlgK [Planctomycetes bacterium RBG_13_44_8b]|nr:MAG: flagellar hook-associated protein FlgK [Planctomycetes bacterium RBG_13_44_8b]
MTGLEAAQKALDVIGNNIANAATDGYHRQRIHFTPAYSSQTGSVIFGGGVDIASVSRLIDSLLEQEILVQQSSFERISQELTTLQTVETTFGELSTGSTLSKTIDDFFNALQNLCTHPSDSVWQNNVIATAQNLTDQFQMLAAFLDRLENEVQLEAQNIIEEINTLTSQIAEFNDKIERIEISGNEANNLRDQRDQLIVELAKLTRIETCSREYGVIDVNIESIPVVSGTASSDLEVGLNEDESLRISVAGTYLYNTDVQSGQLGGLFTLNNELISDIIDDLNTLAKYTIQIVNQYHVQGVGSEGSFTELLGSKMISENFVDFDPPVTDGEIYIRVTNTSTGEITRHKIEINATTDSLSTIADDISDNIDGLESSVDSSRLNIHAQPNYEFDFLPAVLSEPTEISLSSGSAPTISVSGIYNDTENQTFTFTVIGTDSVGNGNLKLKVTNGDDEIISTLNIGSGYAAGDILELDNGIKISVSTGDLNEDDYFEIDAFYNTDTSGVLSVAGINTLFSGSSASDIAVCSTIVNSPGRIATSLGANMTDNTNAFLLANLRYVAASSLDGYTIEDFYHRIIADTGQQISVKEMQQENVHAILQNLTNRQSDISGVNINDEAAQMLIFEQMFQAMAKYLNTVQTALKTIMEII